MHSASEARRISTSIDYAPVRAAGVRQEARRRALRVGINEEYPPPGMHERGGEIDGGGRLADSAFLVRDGDNLHALSVSVFVGCSRLRKSAPLTNLKSEWMYWTAS